jgi:hypothetical protein
VRYQLQCELLLPVTWSEHSLVLTRYRNSTLYSTSPGTYWEQYEEVSQHSAHLNVVERLWSAWYAWMQNDVLATGIMSFVMHEIVYFGRSVPWILIDTLGLFKNYKIQNVSGFDLNASRKALIRLLRIKSLHLGSNGIAPSLSFLATSLWNFRRFGWCLNLTGLHGMFLTVCPQAFPPHGSILRSVYVGSFSLRLDHDVPDSHFLCS